MASSLSGWQAGLVCVILNLGSGHEMYCLVLCVGPFGSFAMVWPLEGRMQICLWP